MIKKVLIPLSLIVAIVLLAWKFFSVPETSQEELDPFFVLPSNTIALDIRKDVDDDFLGRSVNSKTRFICSTFQDEIATCQILNDSLVIDSTELGERLQISNIYSSDTIYSYKKNLFFIDGRKVYSSTNAVLIQQILLKVQKGDLVKLNQNFNELKAITQESKNVLATLEGNVPLLLEYNEINESATAYSFALPTAAKVNSNALSFIPANGENFTLVENELNFDWENIHFKISSADSLITCEKRYRDAKICTTDSVSSAYINGLLIESSNESATINLIDLFYSNSGLQNVNENQDIAWLTKAEALTDPIIKLAPKFIQKAILLSYTSSKKLKIVHILSGDKVVQRSAVDPGEFTVNFSETIIYGPYAVKNHRSKSQCLMVQTADFTLYYLNGKGKTLWKAKIDGEILGAPIEIDRFRNNKVQYVFNTKTKLYQIDILGRSVSGFPKKINSTGPAVLVKYKARKERILVPNGSRLKNLLLDGKSTKGWSSIKLDSDIEHVAYRKIKSLDCILATTKTQAYILNPRGQKRGEVKNFDAKNKVAKIASKAAYTNIFYLDDAGKLFIGNTKANKAEKFSDDTFVNLVDAGNYVYAIGEMQLVLFTSNGDLVENKFLNETPWATKEAVLYNDGNSYSLFMSPGTRCSIKSPNKAHQIIPFGNKITFSESKNLHFVDRL